MRQRAGKGEERRKGTRNKGDSRMEKKKGGVKDAKGKGRWKGGGMRQMGREGEEWRKEIKIKETVEWEGKGVK